MNKGNEEDIGCLAVVVSFLFLLVFLSVYLSGGQQLTACGIPIVSGSSVSITSQGNTIFLRGAEYTDMLHVAQESGYQVSLVYYKGDMPYLIHNINKGGVNIC